MKILSTASIATMIGVASLVMASYVYAEERVKGRGGVGAPVVYVTSQGLYYDSIALGELPQQGDFQRLAPGSHGLETDYGPGDPGHLGGRWWLDVNTNYVMDEGDQYFLCPLLGPGREDL